MSKEFIDSRIDAAHDLIDQGDFDGAVTILKNVKIRIHDPTIERLIREFEQEYDGKAKEKLNKLRKMFEDAIVEAGNEYEIGKSYAIAYLNFYDKLRKEHELY